MKDIDQAISQMQDQIRRLEKDISALQRAREILAEKELGHEKPKSQPDMVYSVLDEAGKPMHVSQITERVNKIFGLALKATNIGVILFRYAQRGKRFYKVKGKPNTYGLIKWESKEALEDMQQTKLSIA